MKPDGSDDITVEELFKRILSSEKLYLVLRSQHKMFRYSIDQNDFFQQVLLIAWRERATFHGRTEAKLLAWLKTIARNIGFDQLRKKDREKRLLDLLYRVMRSPTDVSRLELEEFWKWILAGLTKIEQAVLRMRYHQGLSPAEIARNLNIHVQAVIQHHYRAIQQLRRRQDTDIH